VTLEALLTFAGILVGVLAIARPVQRHSLFLFGSVRRLFPAILISFLLIVCRDAPFGVHPPFGWSLPRVLFGLTVGAFLIPVLAAVWSWASWNRARLTSRRVSYVENLFQAALREREFDEVERIVRKNLQNLSRLPARAVSVLFDRAMVAALVDSHSLVHLELLSNMSFLKLETVGFAEVDTVIRVLLRSEVSPLRSAVLKRFGGQEHIKYTEEEQDLMEKTFEEPEWYTLAGAHYPLVISAVEALRTGKLDDDYNDVGRDYEADHGISRRSHCPVYLAEKTEVIAIESAIEKKFEGDLYVSDLWDIFRAVLERSRFKETIWESPLSHPEFPTPYAYLLYEINFDLRRLSASAVLASISNTQPPRAELKGRFPGDLAQTWSFCVWNISGSKGQVSPDFRKYAIKQYLIFILELGWGPSEVSPGIENSTVGLDAWRDLFLRELQQRFSGDSSGKEILKEAMESLDRGKRYVYDGLEWLEEKLIGSSSTS
jgi:hypothetical protein